MYRKTEALINLDAIRNNYSLASALAPQSKNIAVIKADAYGHGMLRVAEALHDVVPAFAVAIVDEALELRAAGISHPLLVLEGASDTGGHSVHTKSRCACMLFCRTDVMARCRVCAKSNMK